MFDNLWRKFYEFCKLVFVFKTAGAEAHLSPHICEWGFDPPRVSLPMTDRMWREFKLSQLNVVDRVERSTHETQPSSETRSHRGGDVRDRKNCQFFKV